MTEKNNSETKESFSGAHSINISFTPPLENISITEGWNGELKAPDGTVDISVVNNLPCSVFNRVALRLNDLELETGQVRKKKPNLI